MVKPEKRERRARFKYPSIESLDKAIADFHCGDWGRQAGGEIVDGAYREV